MNTPMMDPGTVEMVSVEWIMQNTTGSVDGYTEPTRGFGRSTNYQEMMWDKSRDHQFAALANRIMNEGFRVPIVLSLNLWHPGDIVHGNGHHRMAAAILLGLDEIPVYWDADEDYMSEHTSEGEEYDEDDDGDLEGLDVDNLDW